MSAIVSKFEAAPLDRIAPAVETLRTSFNSQKTKPLDYRLVQLRKLYWGIKDNEAALVEACRIDLGKPVFEAYVAEIDWCKNDIIFTCNNLPKWAKDESAPDMALANKLLSPKIRKDPLGCILIIGAYNCPIQLTFGPLIGAIAAGNTALIKPSEQAPSVAMVLQKILMAVMDPECYICIQGGVPETTALLKQTWDKIFYTGGTKVGKIIAKKAAETLTPVTLELGGKNPAIVTKNADIKLAARRLLWAKVNNAGQICTSQNYALVDREVIAAFVEGLKIAMNDFFPEGAKTSVDFGRIINHHTQWKRLDDSIKKSNGKTIIHGLMDEIDRLIEPTVIEVTEISDNLIAEENFGPIFPILAVDGLDHAIKLANQIDSTPLAAYPFGTKQETDRILQECRSGGASVNDGFIHSAIPTLQFGGIGQSGQGAYRGKESFNCFTHRRSVTTTPSWAEGLISVRYPPYKNNLTKIQRMTNLKPNFNRDGSVISWLVYALSWITTIEDGGSSRSAEAKKTSPDPVENRHAVGMPENSE